MTMNAITKVTPQLVVAPTTAMEAVHLYEQIFGARLVRYNQFPKQASSGSSSAYQLFVCAEVELGSNTFVVTDCDDVPPPLPLSKVCIRLECSNLKGLMEKAEINGCEIVEKIAEETCRPGVLVGKIKDRFGHIWELSSSAGGISDCGFTDKARMTVLLADWTQKHHFDCFPGTPKVTSIREFSQLAAIEHLKFDPFVLDLDLYSIVRKCRKRHNDMLRAVSEVRDSYKFRVTIVGLVSWHTSANVMSEFGEAAGGDILYIVKPLDYSKVSEILFHTLKKKKDNEEKKRTIMKSEVEHATSVSITDLTPQLVVASTSGMWVVQFYEDLFGAKLIQYNKFESRHSFVCAEVEVGSNRFVITNQNYQMIASRVKKDVTPRVCLRLECSNLSASMLKAQDMECKILKNISEDPWRPGVLVGKIEDIFGHIWELCSSVGGVSDGGFMDKENMNVLIAEPKHKQRWNSGYHFESFPGTPRVASWEAKLTAQDVFNHMSTNQHSPFNPIVLGLEDTVIAEKLRNNLNFGGTMAGLGGPYVPYNAWTNFDNAGGDIMYEKPLDYSMVGSMLVQTLRKEKLRRDEEEKEEAVKKQQIKALKMKKKKKKEHALKKNN